VVLTFSRMGIVMGCQGSEVQILSHRPTSSSLSAIPLVLNFSSTPLLA